MKRPAILLIIVLVLLLAEAALAMSSPNFRLDWFTPLDNSSAGSSNSAGYRMDVSVGQVSGSLSGASQRSCLGYQCGTSGGFGLYLPVVTRDHR